MEEQVSEMEREVIITNNNLLFHFDGHNIDLLILKQWKGALNRIVPSHLSILKSNNLAVRTQPLLLRRPQSSEISYITLVNMKSSHIYFIYLQPYPLVTLW